MCIAQNQIVHYDNVPTCKESVMGFFSWLFEGIFESETMPEE